MTNNFSKILTGITICAASTVAFANGDNLNSPTSLAKQGFVIGIDGGYGYLSSPEAVYPNDYSDKDLNGDTYSYTSSSDVGDWVWGLNVGYNFKISQNMLIGFELGYKDLGSSNNSFADKNVDTNGVVQYTDSFSRDYQQNAVDLLLTTHYYIYNGLNIFGKAGAAYVRSDINQNASQVYRDESINMDTLNGDNDIWRIEPEVSLGVGYTFGYNIDVHAAYTYIGGANDQSIVNYDNNDENYLPKAKVYSTNMVTLGVSYTF